MGKRVQAEESRPKILLQGARVGDNKETGDLNLCSRVILQAMTKDFN